MTSRAWSLFQTCIFDFVQYERGNAIIEAVAGSGKTTTIVEAIRRISFSCPNNIFLAFNKSIAEELKSRGVDAKTFHSLTFTPVIRHMGVDKVNPDKTRSVMNKVLTFENIKLYGAFIIKLVSLAKQIGIGCLTLDIEENWYNLAYHHDLSLDSEKANFSRAISLSREIFLACNTDRSVDFDDLLYFAVKDGISLPKYDFVFVDEAQDTNMIQRAILKKITTQNARLVAVGDPSQAIYGFRGSDSDSLNNIYTEFSCTRLPLTVSYRCPQAVVRYAKQWVSHIEHSESAPEGEVKERKSMEVGEMIPGDMVVCRTVKPLISIAYRMMKLKKTAPYIMGRDIGSGLVSLIKKMNAVDLDGLVTKLSTWRDREVEIATTMNQESKIQSIEDKYDTIICLIDELETRSIDVLIDVIENLFSDKSNSVTFCTIHKSKGLEAERVIWIDSRKMPSKWAKLPWQKQQELNLCYVATTRAKQTLILVEEENVK